MLKVIKIGDMFSPDIVPDVVVDIGQIGDISHFLIFCPLLIDGFGKFDQSFLEFLEILVIPWKHVAKVPLAFVGVAVEVVAVHVFGPLSGRALAWFEVYLVYLCDLRLMGLNVVLILGLMGRWWCLTVGTLSADSGRGIVLVILRLHSTIQNIIIMKILYLPLASYY